MSEVRLKESGVCADLLRALERARSQFAVAIATESKRITTVRLHQYLETDREMRKWVKELRCHQGSGGSADPNWNEAIRAVRALLISPACGGSAQHLSARMREVMNQYRRAHN